MDVNEFYEFWELSNIKKLKDSLGSDEVELLVYEYGEKNVMETLEELEKMGIDISTLSPQSIRTNIENFNKHKKKG